MKAINVKFVQTRFKIVRSVIKTHAINANKNTYLMDFNVVFAKIINIMCKRKINVIPVNKKIAINVIHREIVCIVIGVMF